MKNETIAIERRKLETAIHGDFRQLPVSYPVLAKYGFLDRTSNGFRAVSPDVIVKRCRTLLAQLEEGFTFDSNL